MKALDLDKYPWVDIQEYHNRTGSIKKTLKKFSISKRCFNRAVEQGFLIKNLKPYKLTYAQKKNLSVKRKEWLKNNPNKHPWKNSDKFISKPCELLKQWLRDNNLSFTEEFTDLGLLNNYSLDIAFPSVKLCIEVNGNQHYTKSGKLRAYYKKRQQDLESIGWTVLQVRASSLSNIDVLYYLKSVILDYYTTNSTKNSILEDFKPKYCLKCGKRLRSYSEDYCAICFTKLNNLAKKHKILESRKIMILESNIDFSKFGWLNKAAKLLNLSHTQTRRWLKTNMKDFYDKCYHRV